MSDAAEFMQRRGATKRRPQVCSLIFALLFLAAPASAPAAEPAPTAPDCTTPAACAAVLETFRIPPAPAPGAYASSGIQPGQIKAPLDRLRDFGEAGVDAIIPLLRHPNPYVRHRAGYALGVSRSIAPRHAAALIAADRAGAMWLHSPIAATGTDEALDYLWQDFLADPQSSSNSPVFAALARFGTRVHPRVEAQMQACSAGADATLCAGLNDLILAFRPLPPFAIDGWLAIARSPTALDDVRTAAIGRLAAERHPYALTVLIERLEQHWRTTTERAPEPIGRRSDYDFDAAGLMMQIGRYGEAGAAAGPLIVRYLSPDQRDYARQAAVRTLAQIRYRPGADAVLTLRGEFQDNWALAYNAAETLGRLGAGEAELKRLARDHWYWLVRHNAERALNLIAGGDFARPGVAGDGDRPDGFSSYGYQYAGDFDFKPPACPVDGVLTYSQLDPGPLPWPPAKAAPPMTLKLAYPDADELSAFLTRYPGVTPPRRGGPLLAARLGRHAVVGSNAGEFGGDIQALDGKGASLPLIADNAIALFRTGKTLLVVTGLSHGSLSNGDLWVLKAGRQGPQVTRRIRLPTTPYGFRVTRERILILGAPGKDLAITADGRVVDPLQAARCGDPPRDLPG